jgi:hypothetical protein
MKKVLYMLALISILSVSVMAQTDVTVQEVASGTTTSSTVIVGIPYLKTTLANQDPYPADPGSYVNVLFQIENIGTESAGNTTVEIIPQYPFSLDIGTSAITNIGTIAGLQTGNNAFQVRYRLRVDDNAINGDNEIKLKVSVGGSSVYNLRTFNISVSNPRTEFAAVAQDSTTLAIANTGANTASSVIVSIPEQEGFRVSGASSTIIGNLNAGDYTLATFQIESMANAGGRNFTAGSASSNDLKVDISYTDTLGIRRTVELEVPFVFSASGNFTGSGTFVRTTGATGSSTGMLYIVIGVVGIVVVVAFIKLRTRKRKK